MTRRGNPAGAPQENLTPGKYRRPKNSPVTQAMFRKVWRNFAMTPKVQRLIARNAIDDPNFLMRLIDKVFASPQTMRADDGSAVRIQVNIGGAGATLPYAPQPDATITIPALVALPAATITQPQPTGRPEPEPERRAVGQDDGKGDGGGRPPTTRKGGEGII